ncbi:MAG TPA: alkaline phosphatase family protein [Bryobacteraceae bacterium]|nr:alkaline phosphatase family protein [Bryobacteraceae bacterium]
MAGALPVVFAYVGPGAGFAFLGSFATLALSVLAVIGSLLLWPFRMLRMALLRRGMRPARVKKAIFLGLDGLDPDLTEKWMAEGKLPNLARLKEQGSYRRLRTTCPALSPVAWSTFATGVNPAKHNIFDFLNRDLRSYAPELASARVRAPQRVLRIGKFEIPLARPSVEMRRKSEPFWNILGRHGVSSTILRVPVTFPPDNFNGRMLSAMSTPDLRGSQGTFSLFTRAEGALQGPENAAPIAFRVADAAAPVLEIQNQKYPLAVGEYTPWIRLKFRAHGGSSVAGIVRFLLCSNDAEFALYATPVQIDPENPALPISQPAYYAAYLAKLLGSFATLGLAEDTWALNDGAIDEDGFLKQAEFIQKEREAMFFSALGHLRRGVLACVFDTSDRVQHMFYRYLHPSSAGGRHADAIERMYRDMDRLVGAALAQAGQETAFFVLSDHGFCSFRRGVNINSWLRDNGYLALEEGRLDGGEYFDGIDWSRTRAYTFGLGGIYLNLRGREARGTVDLKDAPALKAELIGKLAGLKDDEKGEVAIQNVYATSEIYRGPYLDAAPDLIAGYARGYRTSWDAAVGKVTARVFEDNTKAWSGDHCVDPALVPGVLFSNLKLNAENPGIEDLAPTALGLFGIDLPPWMEGKPVLDVA